MLRILEVAYLSYWQSYRLKEGLWLYPWQGQGFLFSSISRPTVRPTQSPPIRQAPFAFSPGVKRPERKDDRSPPCCSQVTNVWVVANFCFQSGTACFESNDSASGKHTRSHRYR
jgi:hypothetical protein